MLSSNKQTRSAVKSKKKAVKVEYCNYEEADSRASIKARRKGAGAGGTAMQGARTIVWPAWC
jgi:hypothetical protein